jgi:hypothetical protein
VNIRELYYIYFVSTEMIPNSKTALEYQDLCG